MSPYRAAGSQAKVPGPPTLNDKLNAAYKKGGLNAATADLDEIAKRWLRILVDRAERSPKDLHDGKVYTNSGSEPERLQDFIDSNIKGIAKRINALLKEQAPDYECTKSVIGVYLKRKAAK